MKNGKNPSRSQKVLLKTNGANPDNWLVTKNLPHELHVTHRHTGTARVVRK